MGETAIPFTFWKNADNEYTPRKFDCKSNQLGEDEIFKFNNDQSELILVFEEVGATANPTKIILSRQDYFQ